MRVRRHLTHDEEVERVESRRLVRDTALIAGSQASGQALVGLTFLVAARFSGPENFGVYATLLAVSTIAVSVFDFGLTTYCLRELSGGRLSAGQIRVAFARKRTLAVAVTGTIFCLDFFVVRHVLGAFFSCLIFWIVWEIQSVSVHLRAIQRYRPMVIGQVAGRAASFAVVGVSIVAGSFQPWQLAMALAAGWLVDLSIERGAVMRSFRAGGHAPIQTWQLQMHARPFGFSSLSYSAQQLDTPVVSFFANSLQAGLYAAAGRLIGPLSFLAWALNSVSISRLSRARSNGRFDAESRRVMRLSLVVALVPVLALVFGPGILTLLLGPSFNGSGDTFRVLALGAVALALSQGFGVVLQATNHQRFVGVVNTIAVVVGLVVSGALSGVAADAAWGYVVSQFIGLCALSAYFYYRRSRKMLDVEESRA